MYLYKIFFSSIPTFIVWHIWVLKSQMLSWMVMKQIVVCIEYLVPSLITTALEIVIQFRNSNKVFDNYRQKLDLTNIIATMCLINMRRSLMSFLRNICYYLNILLLLWKICKISVNRKKLSDNFWKHNKGIPRQLIHFSSTDTQTAKLTVNVKVQMIWKYIHKKELLLIFEKNW